MLCNDAVIAMAERTERLLQSGDNDLDLDVPKTLHARTDDVGSVAVGLLCKVAEAPSTTDSLTLPQTAEQTT